MIYKVIVGVASGALGFFIGWKTRGHKANKELNDICERISKELSDMKRELEAYHELFVTANPEQAGEREKLWKQVSEDIKKGRKKLAEEKSSPKETKDENDNSIARKRPAEDITDYRSILTKNRYDCDLPNENNGVVRKTAANGIVEIEEYESREFMDSSTGWNNVDLYYYEMSSDVYDEQENMLDGDEIESYVGYNAEELAIRFLHVDEPQDIYVKNPAHNTIYHIYCCQGVGPQ